LGLLECAEAEKPVWALDLNGTNMVEQIEKGFQMLETGRLEG